MKNPKKTGKPILDLKKTENVIQKSDMISILGGTNGLGFQDPLEPVDNRDFH